MGGFDAKSIMTHPNMRLTRTADKKVLTGQEKSLAGQGFASVLAGKAPSASEKAVLLGGEPTASNKLLGSP